MKNAALELSTGHFREDGSYRASIRRDCLNVFAATAQAQGFASSFVEEFQLLFFRCLKDVGANCCETPI